MTSPVDSQSERDGYEHRDARVRNLLYVGLIILATLLVSAAGVAGLIRYFDLQTSTAITRAEAHSQIPPEPRLEAFPPANGEEIVSQARQRLEHYAWIDRSAGVVQIPISRAISILTETGWPQPSGNALGAEPRETQTYRKATQ